MLLKRFELILYILDSCFIGAIIASLFQKDWGYAAILFILGSPLGVIAAQLPHNQRRSGKELRTNPTRPSEVLRSVPESEEAEAFSIDDRYELYGAAAKTSLLVGLALGVSGFHLGLHWYLTLPLALIGGLAFLPISMLAVFGLTFWSNRHAIRAERQRHRQSRLARTGQPCTSVTVSGQDDCNLPGEEQDAADEDIPF